MFTQLFHRTGSPSYQTVRLDEYSLAQRELADEVFARTMKLCSGSRLKTYAGSYSVFTQSGATLAKLVIYEMGLGKMNGDWPDWRDGVYVLVRADGRGDRFWRDIVPKLPAETRRRLIRDETVGVAPKHDERFAYFRIDHEDIDLAVNLLAACAQC